MEKLKNKFKQLLAEVDEVVDTQNKYANEKSGKLSKQLDSIEEYSKSHKQIQIDSDIEVLKLSEQRGKILTRATKPI